MIIRSRGIHILKKNLFEGKGEPGIEILFSPDEFKASVKFCARVKLPAGCSIGLHCHTNEDELYFITQGSGETSDGETSRNVSAGDCILTVSGESHSIENTGSEDLILIAVIQQICSS
jgi:mannose-6-phosphate isomerase-like protein (cupin superfamily)